MISTVAGNGYDSFSSSGDGEVATNAALNGSFGVVVDANGNIFFADESNHRIRKVDNHRIPRLTGQR